MKNILLNTLTHLFGDIRKKLLKKEVVFCQTALHLPVSCTRFKCLLQQSYHIFVNYNFLFRLIGSISVIYSKSFNVLVSLD